MPQYSYSNPNNPSEIIDVIQRMTENHVFIKDGISWNRIFYAGQASFDTKWDANNAQDFVEKTKKKSGNMNDLWSQSAELSQKREKQFGVDSVKENYIKNQKERRKGKKLFSEVQEAKNKTYEIDLKIK